VPVPRQADQPPDLSQFPGPRTFPPFGGAVQFTLESSLKVSIPKETLSRTLREVFSVVAAHFFLPRRFLDRFLFRIPR